MGNVLELGPLVFSLDRLVAVGAIWLFIAAGHGIGARLDTPTDRIAWPAALIGIIAARVAYVWENAEAYSGRPLESLYLWQGGFSAAYGVLSTTVVLLVFLRGKARRLSLALLGVLFALWLLFEGITRNQRVQALPKMEVTDIRGMPTRLEARSGPYVINIWATWCPPCRREMPMMQEVAKANPDVPVIFLNQGQTRDEVSAFLRGEQMGNGNILIDPNGNFAAAVGATALPTTIFVGADGKVHETHVGEISRAALMSGMRDLRAR